MKDYYSILGIQSDADDAAIKKAYRQLAKENHPDLFPGDLVKESKFKEVSEAHDILKDPAKRSQYDISRSPHPSFNEFKPTWNHNFSSGTINLDDILRDLQRSRNPYAAAPESRNRDITLLCQVTLEEVFTGKETSIKYRTADGTIHDFTFKIPEGINDGVRLRFQGRGDDAIKEINPGDLYIKIHVLPNNSFIRMGNNLHTSISIDYLDAMLGCEVEIPTIEGKNIKMKVPEGIQPGQSLRAKNKGMQIGHGSRGDMLVEIVIQPTMLNDEQRQLIEQARQKRA